MRVPKYLQPRFTTVVPPEEYHLDLEMVAMVKIANEDRAHHVLMDVGKVVGLYLAYVELLNGGKVGVEWDKIPEVIQPDEIHWKRFIKGTDWDE